MLHLFGTTYGWGMGDVDELTVREANYLIEKINREHRAQARAMKKR